MIAFAIIETILLSFTGGMFAISCAVKSEKEPEPDVRTRSALVIIKMGILAQVLAILLIWKLIYSS